MLNQKQKEIVAAIRAAIARINGHDLGKVVIGERGASWESDYEEFLVERYEQEQRLINSYEEYDVGSIYNYEYGRPELIINFPEPELEPGTLGHSLEQLADILECAELASRVAMAIAENDYPTIKNKENK